MQVRVQNHGTEPITISRIFGSYYDTGPREKALMNVSLVIQFSLILNDNELLLM